MTRKLIISVLFALPILRLGCVTPRSAYEPMTQNGGYKDGETGGIRVARFVGNAKTSPDDSRDFSLFRAIEYCREEGFKVARVYLVNDMSHDNVVHKSATNTYSDPVAVSGTSNTDSN